MISDNYVVGDNAYLKELQNFFFEVLGMMSITHYGCVGDGRVDNYGPLQVAIDDAHRRGLSFLYVPYGRFIYTGQLNNLDGLTFMGNPHAKILNIRTGVEIPIQQFGWQSEVDLDNYYTKGYINANYYTKTEDDQNLLVKQDRLTAGSGIDITDGVISSTITGGGAVCAITATLETDQTMIDNAERDVGLTAFTLTGEGLELDDNAIEIGNGITKIEVSALGYIDQNSTSLTDLPTLNVYKNSTIIASSYGTLDTSEMKALCTAPLIVSVEAGDKISLKFAGNMGDKVCANTYLTVEAVEIEGGGGGTTIDAFFSCPFPTTWTEDGSKMNATGTNTYGTWTISTDATPASDGTVGVHYIFDGNFETSHHSVMGATSGDTSKIRSATIELPSGVSINPVHLKIKSAGTRGTTSLPLATTFQGYSTSTNDWVDLYVKTTTGTTIEVDDDVETADYFSKFRLINIYAGYGSVATRAIYEIQVTDGYIKEVH